LKRGKVDDVGEAKIMGETGDGLGLAFGLADGGEVLLESATRRPWKRGGEDDSVNGDLCLWLSFLMWLWLEMELVRVVGRGIRVGKLVSAAEYFDWNTG
jgi:hypothetical protein